jgi:hypothetical protein
LCSGRNCPVTRRLTAQGSGQGSAKPTPVVYRNCAAGAVRNGEP